MKKTAENHHFEMAQYVRRKTISASPEGSSEKQFANKQRNTPDRQEAAGV